MEKKSSKAYPTKELIDRARRKSQSTEPDLEDLIGKNSTALNELTEQLDGEKGLTKNITKLTDEIINLGKALKFGGIGSSSTGGSKPISSGNSKLKGKDSWRDDYKTSSGRTVPKYRPKLINKVQDFNPLSWATKGTVFEDMYERMHEKRLFKKAGGTGKGYEQQQRAAREYHKIHKRESDLREMGFKRDEINQYQESRIFRSNLDPLGKRKSDANASLDAAFTPITPQSDPDRVKPGPKEKFVASEKERFTPITPQSDPDRVKPGPKEKFVASEKERELKAAPLSKEEFSLSEEEMENFGVQKDILKTLEEIRDCCSGGLGGVGTKGAKGKGEDDGLGFGDLLLASAAGPALAKAVSLATGALTGLATAALGISASVAGFTIGKWLSDEFDQTEMGKALTKTLTDWGNKNNSERLNRERDQNQDSFDTLVKLNEVDPELSNKIQAEIKEVVNAITEQKRKDNSTALFGATDAPVEPTSGDMRTARTAVVRKHQEEIAKSLEKRKLGGPIDSNKQYIAGEEGRELFITNDGKYSRIIGDYGPELLESKTAGFVYPFTGMADDGTLTRRFMDADKATPQSFVYPKDSNAQPKEIDKERPFNINGIKGVEGLTGESGQAPDTGFMGAGSSSATRNYNMQSINPSSGAMTNATLANPIPDSRSSSGAAIDQRVKGGSSNLTEGQQRVGMSAANIKKAFIAKGYSEEQADVFARGAAAQLANETGWGDKSKEIGKNNLFNIKEHGNQKGDIEGTRGTDPVTGKTDIYAGYSTPEKGAEGYVDFLLKNPRYQKAGVFDSKNIDEYAEAMQRGRFAEDANYAQKIKNIARGKTMSRAMQAYENPNGQNANIQSAMNGEGPQKSLVRAMNSGKIRNQPITPELDQRISDAVRNVYGEDYTAELTSGGQDKEGQGLRRTGSTRHDEGKAGDVIIRGPDGKQVQGDDLGKLGQYWMAKKYGGVGMEMAGGAVHLDQHTDRHPNWDYSDKGGRYTKAQKEAIEAGKQGIMPELVKPKVKPEVKPEDLMTPGWEEQLAADMKGKGTSGTAGGIDDSNTLTSKTMNTPAKAKYDGNRDFGKSAKDKATSDVMKPGWEKDFAKDVYGRPLSTLDQSKRAPSLQEQAAKSQPLSNLQKPWNELTPEQQKAEESRAQGIMAQHKRETEPAKAKPIDLDTELVKAEYEEKANNWKHDDSKRAKNELAKAQAASKPTDARSQGFIPNKVEPINKADSEKMSTEDFNKKYNERQAELNKVPKEDVHPAIKTGNEANSERAKNEHPAIQMGKEISEEKAKPTDARSQGFVPNSTASVDATKAAAEWKLPESAKGSSKEEVQSATADFNKKYAEHQSEQAKISKDSMHPAHSMSSPKSETAKPLPPQPISGKTVYNKSSEVTDQKRAAKKPQPSSHAATPGKRTAGGGGNTGGVPRQVGGPSRNNESMWQQYVLSRYGLGSAAK